MSILVDPSRKSVMPTDVQAGDSSGIDGLFWDLA